MIRLKKESYSLVTPLLKRVEINSFFANNVAEGYSDGVVYVDNKQNPETAYIKHRCGMSLLFGNPDNQIFIDNILNKIANKEGLQAYPKEIHKTIKSSPYYTSIKEYVRLNLKFNREKFNEESLDCGVLEVKRINDYSFSCFKGRVVPSAYFNNEEDFIKHGVCYGVVDNEEVVSWAVSSFRGENSLEIGVVTLEKCRGKNYAYRACSEFINYCLDRGIEPVWSCEELNIGSWNLAKKLGFEVELKTPIYSIP